MLGGGERKHRQSGDPSAHARRPAHAPASSAGRPRRTSLTGIVCGGLTGFLLGAAFWIVLGVQDLGVPELSGSAAPRLVPSADRQGDIPDCTSLALDRRKGHTTAEPCPSLVLPLREASANLLGDRSVP
jgi:hypothetical protein